MSGGCGGVAGAAGRGSGGCWVDGSAPASALRDMHSMTGLQCRRKSSLLSMTGLQTLQRTGTRMTVPHASSSGHTRAVSECAHEINALSHRGID